MLGKLSATADKMFEVARESKDPAEMRAAANMLKQVMDAAIKFGDKIDASDRAMKVENALVSAINAYGDADFRDKFLDFLKNELEK